MELLTNAKALRIIIIAVLIHAIFVVFGQLLLVVGTLMKEPEEGQVLAEGSKALLLFPLYFLTPLFIAIIVYASRSLIQKKYNYKIIIWLAVFSALYFAFGGELYVYIQRFHPLYQP